MRVLITGGAGFIGSHLSDAYLKRGDEVYVIDDLSTGTIENIQHQKTNPRFHYIIDTVRNQPVTAELVDQCDVIFHLAAAVGVKLIVESPVRTIETNVRGTEVVLSLANKKKKKVLIASTSEVYGDPFVHPQPESYFGNVNTHGPRSCYDEGKRSAETLFFDYSRTYGLDIRVARIFNTYGRRMQPDDGRVVSNFIVQALRGQDLTVYGSGMQTRSFCYAEDLIEGFVRLMNAPSAPAMLPMAWPSNPCCADATCSVFRMSNLTTYLVLFSLPMPRNFRAACGSPRL